MEDAWYLLRQISAFQQQSTKKVPLFILISGNKNTLKASKKMEWKKVLAVYTNETKTRDEKLLVT